MDLKPGEACPNCGCKNDGKTMLTHLLSGCVGRLLPRVVLLEGALCNAPLPDELDLTNPERFKRIYAEWYDAKSQALTT